MTLPPLYQGRIIVAVAPTGRGQAKDRPMVITTHRRDIEVSGEFAVVVLSTKFTFPLGPDEILIPIDGATERSTKLRRPCVAVCDWKPVMSKADIVDDRGGYLPPSLLTRIVERLGLSRESYR